jgi:hypothetical protein
MPNTGRNLIRAAGGDMEPGEKLKGYFWRVAELTGIGIRSIERAWRDDYVSKNTARKARKAAIERAKTSDFEFIARAEKEIADLEAINPVFYRAHIAVGREFVARWREVADTRSCVVVRDGPENDETEP